MRQSYAIINQIFPLHQGYDPTKSAKLLKRFADYWEKTINQSTRYKESNYD